MDTITCSKEQRLWFASDRDPTVKITTTLCTERVSFATRDSRKAPQMPDLVVKPRDQMPHTRGTPTQCRAQQLPAGKDPSRPPTVDDFVCVQVTQRLGELRGGGEHCAVVWRRGRPACALLSEQALVHPRLRIGRCRMNCWPVSREPVPGAADARQPRSPSQLLCGRASQDIMLQRIHLRVCRTWRGRASLVLPSVAGWQG